MIGEEGGMEICKLDVSGKYLPLLLSFLFPTLMWGQWAEDASFIEREYLQKPSLNHASVQEIAFVEGLTEYDAFTITQYIRQMRSIRSWWPLLDLPGIDKTKLNVLQRHFSLEVHKHQRRNLINGFYQTQWEIDESEIFNKERWGLTGIIKNCRFMTSLERDPGEPWVGRRGLNHHTFSIAYTPSRLQHWKVLLGDIHSRLGTGLSLQTQFAMNRLYQPIQVLRMGSQFTPYGGFQEQSAFKGLALCRSNRPIKFGIHLGWRPKTQSQSQSALQSDNIDFLSNPMDPSHEGYNQWNQYLLAAFAEYGSTHSFWGVAISSKHQPKGNKPNNYNILRRLTVYGQVSSHNAYFQWEGLLQSDGSLGLSLGYSIQGLWILPSRHRLGMTIVQIPNSKFTEDMGGFSTTSTPGTQSVQMSLLSPSGRILNVRLAVKDPITSPNIDIEWPIKKWNLAWRLSFSSYLRSHIKWRPCVGLELILIQSYYGSRFNHWWGCRSLLFSNSQWNFTGLVGISEVPSSILYRPKLIVGTGFPYGGISGHWMELSLRCERASLGKFYWRIAWSPSGDWEFNVGVLLSAAIKRSTP